MRPTLLVLAAGLGTRYGGLKQIDAVGPGGETLIDYGVYDAVRAGFAKVVFVIRHYFEEAFKEKVSARFSDVVATAYAWQELDSGWPQHVPYAVASDRDRPWGTGQAILVSRDTIDGPFAVINADDYYGPGALGTMAAFLAARNRSPNDYAMVGYTLRNTLSQFGVVSRGVCECDDHALLRHIVERKGIELTQDGIRYHDPDGTAHPLAGDETVSMNLWGFQPSIFTHLEVQFARFLRDHSQDRNAELFIPSVVDELIAGGTARVRVLPSKDSWFGVTYRADRSTAQRHIRRLINDGVYPERLWT